MISDHDIERIATAVARKLAEVELDRLQQDLEMERKLVAYEEERRALLRRAGRRRRLLGLVRFASVLILAVVLILVFESL